MLKKILKFKVVIVLCLVLLLCSSEAFAWGGHGGGHDRPVKQGRGHEKDQMPMLRESHGRGRHIMLPDPGMPVQRGREREKNRGDRAERAACSGY